MEHSAQRLEKIARGLVGALAFLLPIWFVPLPVSVALGRELTFGFLMVAATLFWCLAALSHGEFRLRHSPVLYAASALLIIFAASAIWSKAPIVSALYADAAGEKFLTLIFGVLLMFLAGALYRTAEQAALPVLLLVFSGGVGALLSTLQLFGWSPLQIPAVTRFLPFLADASFTPIGTVNGMSLFYAVLFAMAAGLLLSKAQEKWRPWVRWALGGAMLLFLAHIFIVNYRIAWVVMLGSAIFLFGLVFHRARGSGGWRYWSSLAVIAVSVVMIMVQNPVVPGVSVPAEVSPSLSSTLGIAKEVWREGVKSTLLGSGPGTFGLDWSRYKDPALNQTVFWSVRFNQGFSWISTLGATAGVLGFLTFLAFLAVAAFQFLKSLLSSPENPLASSVFLGVASLMIAAFVYPAQYGFVLLFFLLAGILAVFLSRPAEGGGFFPGGFWEITEREAKFSAPWAVFLSSLVLIFIVAGTVAGLYWHVNRARSAWLQQSGARLLDRGDIAGAAAKFERASRAERSNFRVLQSLVVIRTERIRSLIARAAGGENVQQEFQAEISAAIQDSQKAIERHPMEPAVWRTQGALYETVIPFISGSERLAFQSYGRAIELEPANPAIFTEIGRAGLALTDRLQQQTQQARGEEKTALERARQDAIQEIIKALTRATELKPDLASAHFLLAQAALRAGDAASAIRAAENAKLAAPFDIGVAFQLGLLYYQRDDLARAEAEFARAASLNPNYSNARYFLGLIYDRTNRSEEAVAEFEKIAQFNPDNEEVKKILENLRAGRSALRGITPPPERRSDAPLEE